MKHNRLLFNLLFLSCLLLGRCSCERDEVKPKTQPQEPQLPPETEEGKQTFGCLVNGEVWLPTNSFTGGIVATSTYPDQFTITAKRNYQVGNIDWDESVNIRIDNGIMGPGIYKLGKGEMQGKYSKYSASEYSCFGLQTDSVNTGVLEITRWKSANSYIISGRFSFTVYKPGCDTIRVTNGRFDIGL